MQLSKQILKKFNGSGLITPPDAVFQLPEKVLQFGTGVLLRGLPDYFIDKANRQNIFNGRIVVVKSTSNGTVSEFEKQDNLYTLVVRGLEQDQLVEENIICSAISRVLSASSEWDKVLLCAQNPEMQIVISNTTEVGLNLVLEKIDQSPPSSFPGKLLAFLKARYEAFKGRTESGLVIIPTELIPDNAKKLKSILLALAKHNHLESTFIHWLVNKNQFCNSLVDRIVPGKPNEKWTNSFESQFGYSDSLLTTTEVYRLWAIEGNEKVKSVLSFASADAGVVIAPDIQLYRELKLRLLNGTHTLTCGVAFLAGIETVAEAMNNQAVLNFIRELMSQEIGPSIPYEISSSEKEKFAISVLDRFRNLHIRHFWINITVQYSAKMKMRVLPVLLTHYKSHRAVPSRMAFGFATWILFMRVTEKSGDDFFGEWNGVRYPIKDDRAAYFEKEWKQFGVGGIVSAILKDENFWGINLTGLVGFEAAVSGNLKSIISKGVIQVARELY
jgi:tagaturonate reductase